MPGPFEKLHLRLRQSPSVAQADTQSGIVRRPKRLTRRSAGAVLLLLVIFGGGFYWWRTQPSQLEKNRREVATTLQAVGELYDLPDETPVLATVSDKNLLQEQPFFTLAENGDKVLVFNQAQKIILYRPSTNKIINFSNLNPAETALGGTATQTISPVQTASTAPATQEVSRPTIALYNGTPTVGVTQRVQQLLEQQKVTGEVIDRANAAKTDYSKTIVVAVRPAGDKLAAEISGLLGVSKVALPEGEAKPDADVLIIVGQDQVQ